MWIVHLVESERGWGQRVDETLEFEDYDTALEYVKKFNSKNNLDYVPDWYMYATAPEKKIERELR